MDVLRNMCNQYVSANGQNYSMFKAINNSSDKIFDATCSG